MSDKESDDSKDKSKRSLEVSSEDDLSPLSSIYAYLNYYKWYTWYLQWVFVLRGTKGDYSSKCQLSFHCTYYVLLTTTQHARDLLQ